MTRFISFVVASLIWLCGTAHAGDPFTVGGVQVDAFAETAIEAQTQAIQDGQMRAAQVLLDRLTLDSERAAKPLPELTPELIGRMIRALEVGQERRSANRYLGEITVAFNPSQVQQFLREAELTMVSSQARERLVVVLGEAPALRGVQNSNSLRAALADPRHSYALTPLRVAAEDAVYGLSPTPTDAELVALAAQYGLNQVLLVEKAGGGAVVTDVALDRSTRQAFNVFGASGPVDLSDKIVARLESEWKQASAVVADEIVSTPVSVLYDSHNGWITLQEAINTSAQIRGARLDALSKDGALMTITYGGNIDRLANELRFKGVKVEQDPELGLVFSQIR